MCGGARCINGTKECDETRWDKFIECVPPGQGPDLSRRVRAVCVVPETDSGWWVRGLQRGAGLCVHAWEEGEDVSGSGRWVDGGRRLVVVGVRQVRRGGVGARNVCHDHDVSQLSPDSTLLDRHPS
eukprot:2396060-Rhodomonas_salina.2